MAKIQVVKSMTLIPSVALKKIRGRVDQLYAQLTEIQKQTNEASKIEMKLTREILSVLNKNIREKLKDMPKYTVYPKYVLHSYFQNPRNYSIYWHIKGVPGAGFSDKGTATRNAKQALEKYESNKFSSCSAFKTELAQLMKKHGVKA